MNRVLSILFIFISIFSIAQKRMDDSNNTPATTNAYSFIENKGQWDKDILFKSSFKGGNLWVQRKKLMFHLKDYQELRKNHGGGICDTCKNREHVIHLNFEGCNTITQFSSSTPSKEYYNYYLGNDQTKWASNVHAYTETTLHQLYSGIDLKLIQEDEEIKYEFHIQPNANPNQIKLSIAGATSITIDAYDQLQITTPVGNIIEKKPFVYQVIKGKKSEIRSAFEVIENNVQFKLGNYDSSLPLIIDPILVFATYSGSVTDNFGMTATYGYDGTAYSGGTIFGNSYPTPDKGAYNVTSNFTVVSKNGLCSDVFISKYTKDGSQMKWTTFLGGGSNYLGAETIHSLICDSSNNIYGFGATSSDNFPVTTNAFQQSHMQGEEILIKNNGALFKNIGTDIYSFKISSDGKNLLGSTLIGGSGNDGLNYNLTGKSMQYNNNKININGTVYLFIPYDSLTTNYGDQFRGEIMLDSLNNIIIATSTRSKDFPLKNAFQPQLNGQQDGVIFKLKNDFSDLLFSSFIGGSNNDALYSVKVDKSGNLVFCGGTCSTDLSTSTNAYQTTYNGGISDGYIGKVNRNGVLTTLTYIGTPQFDQSYILDLDETNQIYIIGNSIGGNFPVINANFSNLNGSQFIAILNSELSTIVKSTIYGSGKTYINDISPAAFMVDACHNIYVSGWGANIIQNLSEFNLYWGTDPNYYYTGDVSKQNFTKHGGSVLQNMPITPNAQFQSPPNGFDFHLFTIDKNLDKIIYGGYFGGNIAGEHVDGGTSRFDNKGVIYQSICGGCGGSSDFPTTTNAWSNKNLSSNCNNIVMKFDFELLETPKIQCNDTICQFTEAIFTNISQPLYPFFWEYQDKNIDSLAIELKTKFSKPGNYTVNLSMKNPTCFNYIKTSKSITVIDNYLKANASASEHKTLKGSTIKLTGGPNDMITYNWTPNENIKNYNLQNTDTKVDKNTTYTLEVNDGICSSTDTTHIEIIDWVCDFPFVFVPNAFSPNNDNENDILYVRGHPITKIELRIFNRWGEKVFESFDVTNGWDGTYKGKLLEPDVYDYYLLVECSGGLTNQIQGNITLLR